MQMNPDDLTNKQLLEALSSILFTITDNMATKDDLRNELKNYPTKDDLRNELKGYATKDDLKGFATKDDLKKFATKEDLKGLATKDDLKEFATKADLKGEINSLEQKMEHGFSRLENKLDNYKQANTAYHLATRADIGDVNQQLGELS